MYFCCFIGLKAHAFYWAHFRPKTKAFSQVWSPQRKQVCCKAKQAQNEAPNRPAQPRPFSCKTHFSLARDLYAPSSHLVRPQSCPSFSACRHRCPRMAYSRGHHPMQSLASCPRALETQAPIPADVTPSEPACQALQQTTQGLPSFLHGHPHFPIDHHGTCFMTCMKPTCSTQCPPSSFVSAPACAAGLPAVYPLFHVINFSSPKHANGHD